MADDTFVNSAEYNSLSERLTNLKARIDQLVVEYDNLNSIISSKANEISWKQMNTYLVSEIERLEKLISDIEINNDVDDLNLNNNGIVVRSSLNQYVTRIITPGNGIAITNQDGVNGNIIISTDNSLSSTPNLLTTFLLMGS